MGETPAGQSESSGLYEAPADEILAESSMVETPNESPAYAEEPVPRRRISARAVVLSSLLTLLGIAWVALLAWGLAAVVPVGGFGVLRIAAWIGLGAGPLALLAVAWLLLLRTGAVEAGRYAVAAADLRTESLRLAELLTLLNRRIATAREELGAQASALADIGDEAGGRLAVASARLQAEAQTVVAAAATLDEATAGARGDLGVLLTDLPQAEARAAEIGARLAQVGNDAVRNTAALGEHLAAIEVQAIAADQGSTAATRRLAVELERLEGSAVAVDRRLSEAAARLETTSSTALDQAAGTLDQVRRTVEEQGAAIAALLGHGQASFRDIGDESVRLLAGRLDALATRFDAIGGRLRAHESTSRTWVGQIDLTLDAIEARFANFGTQGAEQTADLAEALATLSDHIGAIGGALGQSNQSADGLVGRLETLRAQLDGGRAQLTDELPAALSRLRLNAEQGLEAIDRAVPQAQKLASDAETAAARIVEAGAVMDRHGEATVAVTGQVQALQVLLARIDQTFTHVAEGASTKLVDAMLRVRETAGQAAQHARETLTGVIPRVADELAEAGAAALATRLSEVGRAEVTAVGDAAALAMTTAQGASERLTQQLLALAQATQVLEARFSEHRAAVEAENEGGFARQVGLLIEALNSTAIDVGKLLAQEPSDTEWAAYLKGDRGIFTRRVVRLLESSEAKAVAERYGEDGAFRDLVNRYVHDFETMLRRVLSARDGGMMSVTLLSSDAGKLYVALAQAIERLRK
jgi:hypothetical protein